LFLFPDVPPGTEFGIDLNTWNTGEKFKGHRSYTYTSI
jgi:hypothetical protein